MPSLTDRWCYGGDYGRKWAFQNGHELNLRYSKSYKANDVVGCGWIKSSGEIFFTLNGVNQGNQGNHSFKPSLIVLFRCGIHKRWGNFVPIHFHIWAKVYTEG